MIKVGALHFSNAFPLFHAIQEKIIPNDVSLHWGDPIEINRMLSRGEVDIAMISSSDFLKNRYSYILLSDLGIAASEKMMSIRLFFKGDAPVLHASTVYVPDQSATSSDLLKSLCTHFWKVSPHFKEFEGTEDSLFEQDSPFLLIGDSCLEHHNRTSHSSIDISQAWNEATNKSFIFAVIATRNDAFQRSAHDVIRFHRLLEDSFHWAEGNKEIIVKRAVQKIKCDDDLIRQYYSTIEYRLMSKHFHGLDYFAGLGA